MMRKLSKENIPVTTRHFNKLAKEARMSLNARGWVEPMPAAITHFTLAQCKATFMKRTKIAQLRANPSHALGPGVLHNEGSQNQG